MRACLKTVGFQRLGLCIRIFATMLCGTAPRILPVALFIFNFIERCLTNPNEKAMDAMAKFIG